MLHNLMCGIAECAGYVLFEVAMSLCCMGKNKHGLYQLFKIKVQRWNKIEITISLIHVWSICTMFSIGNYSF